MMDVNNLENISNNILSTLMNILNNHELDCVGRLEYHGKAINIWDNYGTKFWIRVMPLNNRVIADFSSVELREDKRRQGIFDEICESMKHKDFIEKVLISNVCTDEMEAFCKKHNYTYDDMMMTYRVC